MAQAHAGDIISPSTANDYTLGGSPTGKTLAFNFGSGYNGHKIKVIATISASVVGAKTKTATTGETVTIDTEALAATATTISLGKADVFRIDSIFMAADFSTADDSSDTEITDSFDLDTGQRDNFYDIARLVRKPNAFAPVGRLLITFSYYAHGAGNFFNVDSYSGVDYGDIPSYTSDVTGEKFQLRDVLDFRPRVDDASTIDSGSVDRSFDGDGASAIETMKINTDITSDLEFYLSKRARVYITSSGRFKVVEGAPAVDPTHAETLEDAMHIYDAFVPAYTFETKDVELTSIENRRYTMRDIGGLAKRLENVEYYTQLSLLESDAQNLQIQDADGFDRFKNGIIVDNFTGHNVGDVSDDNYSISMDMAQGELRPAHHMDNTNLIESDSSLANSTAMSTEIRTTNGYQKTGDLITLPYTEEAYVTQAFASTTVNLNPYDTIDYIGQIDLSPDQDEWMETNTIPDMVINIPGVFDTIRDGAGNKVKELNLGTVWNNWNDHWSGRDIAGTQETHRERIGRRIDAVTTIKRQQVNNRTRTGIRSVLVPGGLKLQNMGNKVVAVAFASFIRAKDITFTATALSTLTRIFPFFDGVDISAYVTPTGSSAGAALTTDAAGACSGVFSIPSLGPSFNRRGGVQVASGVPRWRTGTRAFRLTTSSTNGIVDVHSSAEADYTAKGMIQTVQGTVHSTREVIVQRRGVSDTSQIVGATGTVELRRQVVGWHDPVCQSFMVDKRWTFCY